MLTTTGRRSGQPRTSPVIYLADGDRLLVFASAGGAAKDPLWFANLVAHPIVTVEVGSDRFTADAVELTGPEREDAYASQAAAHPVYASFQEQAGRRIPVVALTRRTS